MNKELLHKLHLISLQIAFVGLLFPLRISSVCLIFFLLISLIKVVVNSSFKHVVFSKKLLWISSFFLIYLLGVFYSENKELAYQILGRNSIWVLVPVLMFYSVKLTKEQRFKSLFSFALITHLLAIVFLISSLINYSKTGEITALYYTEFTSILDFHPVYFAMYLLFSLGIIINGYSSKFIKLKRSQFISILVLDTILLIFLSSKTILFILFVVLFLILRKYLVQQKKLLLFPFIIVIFSAIFLRFSGTIDRINDSVFSKWELLSKDKFVYNDAFTGVTLRLITWNFATQKIIKTKKYLVGAGTGDGQDFINSVYKDHEMVEAGYTGYNMHNQFLEFFVKFGLLGFVYFTMLVFMFFKKAIQQKDYLYVLFLLIFFTVSLTESNLEVQRGLVFFILFNTLFFFNSSSTKFLRNE